MLSIINCSSLNIIIIAFFPTDLIKNKNSYDFFFKQLVFKMFSCSCFVLLIFYRLAIVYLITYHIREGPKVTDTFCYDIRRKIFILENLNNIYLKEKSLDSCLVAS